jgi:LCP family protein required for cell wall assembly
MTETAPHKRKFTKIIALLVLILLVSIAAIFVSSIRLKGRTANVNADTITNVAQVVPTMPSLDKQTVVKAPEVLSESWQTSLKHNGSLTAVLLVGIDARYAEFNGSEFINLKPEGAAGKRNSDAIMEVVYDNSSGYVFMISIPRDMGMDINLECLHFSGSIFWAYDRGQSAKCPGGGVQVISDVVKNMTGIEPQYHIFITMSSFKEFFDVAGTDNNGQKGFWVDNPSAFSERYPYNDYGWENVFFPAGRQFMNADRSLRFIRSRQFSYDWGRAKRQQIFLEAVKNELLSFETLFNPAKILSIIGFFRDKIDMSQFSFPEIVDALSIARNIDQKKVVNIVMGPDWMGHERFLNRIPHDRPGPYYMVPTQWKQCAKGDEFCKIKDFIKKIEAYPAVYQEQAKVVAYPSNNNTDGKGNFNNPAFQNLLNSDAPVLVDNEQSTVYIDPGNDLVLVDFTNGNKPYTLSVLSKFLNVPVQPGALYEPYRRNGEDVAILVKSH